MPITVTKVKATDQQGKTSPSLVTAQDAKVKAIVDAKRKRDAVSKDAKAAEAKYRSLLNPFIKEVTEVLEDSESKEFLLPDGSGLAISAKSNVTRVNDMQDVHNALELIEPGLFWKLVGISLTDLKKYLSSDEYASLTSTVRTGSRTAKVI